MELDNPTPLGEARRLAKAIFVTSGRADWIGASEVAREMRERGVQVKWFVCNSDDLKLVYSDGFRASDVLGYCGSFSGDGVFYLTDISRSAEARAVFPGWMKPDEGLVVVHGDREEALFAAIPFVRAGYTVAHIGGGDVTLGSTDDRWRGAISALSAIHFPTSEGSARRLRKFAGPAFLFGEPAISRIYREGIWEAAATALKLSLPRDLLAAEPNYLMLNWQPETPEDRGLEAILDALSEVALPVVIIGATPGPGAKVANLTLRTWQSNQKFPVIFHQSLDPKLYRSALAYASCLIGNSSSGIYEAPYLGTPVINVGARQTGRPSSNETKSWRLDLSNPSADDILHAVNLSLIAEHTKDQPFGHRESARMIAETLIEVEL